MKQIQCNEADTIVTFTSEFYLNWQIEGTYCRGTILVKEKHQMPIKNVDILQAEIFTWKNHCL